MGDQQRCRLAVWVESGLVEIRRRQNANGVGAVICTKTGERGSLSRRGAHQTAPGPEGRGERGEELQSGDGEFCMLA